MRIIGFNLDKISAEKKESLRGKIEINQNINIKDISEDFLPSTKESILKLYFNLSINYSNDLARLEFDGSLLITSEKNELKEIMKNWKNKKISEEIKEPLFNFIMNKCNIKALLLEEDMNLPYHIPLPRINFSKKD